MTPEGIAESISKAYRADPLTSLAELITGFLAELDLRRQATGVAGRPSELELQLREAIGLRPRIGAPPAAPAPMVAEPLARRGLDPAMFDHNKLVELLVDTEYGNANPWLSLVEIIPDFMPAFPQADTKPTVRVRCLVDSTQPEAGPGVITSRYVYLCCKGLAGWRSHGYIWQDVGADFLSVEHALLAVVHAPVPPQLLRGVPHD